MELINKCYELTPVQKGSGCYYKREDLFTPFEDSPINGSKLRMCIWLMNNLGAGKNRVVSAASVKSPQLPMVTRVAKEFGKTVELFIGSNNLKAAEKNPMVALAKSYGANFRQSKCAFNSALQHAGKSFATEQDFFLEYGISTTNPDNWKEFYSFGGLQTKNIPEDITKITMTAGSCNSALSVLVGLYNQGKIKDYFYNFLGIGPSKFKMIQERFKHVTGEDLPLENIEYIDIFIDEQKNIPEGKELYTYAQRLKVERDGIVFHPNYEAKMIKWLSNNRPDLLNDETNLIWIVGSEPKL